AKLSGYLDYATELRQVDNPWPGHLMPPKIDSSEEVIQEINNVFFGAVAWILLHEAGHVHLGNEEESGRSHQQEDEEDKFAAEWVFEKVPTEREREFRILGVGVALAWLML